jgi:hypothetical protein
MLNEFKNQQHPEFSLDRIGAFVSGDWSLVALQISEDKKECSATLRGPGTGTEVVLISTVSIAELELLVHNLCANILPLALHLIGRNVGVERKIKATIRLTQSV